MLQFFVYVCFLSDPENDAKFDTVYIVPSVPAPCRPSLHFTCASRGSLIIGIYLACLSRQVLDKPNHYTVYKTQHLAFTLRTIITCSARSSSVKFYILGKIHISTMTSRSHIQPVSNKAHGLS